MYAKWITLTVWHIEIAGPPRQTICGEQMPDLSSRNVVRVERPAVQLKICHKCRKGRKEGAQLQLLQRADPPRGRWS